MTDSEFKKWCEERLEAWARAEYGCSLRVAVNRSAGSQREFSRLNSMLREAYERGKEESRNSVAIDADRYMMHGTVSQMHALITALRNECDAAYEFIVSDVVADEAGSYARSDAYDAARAERLKLETTKGDET